MAVSTNIRNYLRQCGTAYDEIPHSRTFAMTMAAQSAHVSGNCVAKGVVMRAGDDYLLAVLPAPKHVDVSRLCHALGRDVRLIDEAEAAMNFPDCEFGAIPPVGAAYGLQTIVDDSMLAGDMADDQDIFFEGGDHRTLVAIDAADWRRMMASEPHCAFAV